MAKRHVTIILEVESPSDDHAKAWVHHRLERGFGYSKALQADIIVSESR